MIRNLKALGIALAAAFALSAVAASAASAETGQGTLTSDGPVTLHGVHTGEESANALTAFGGETRCPNATYTGHRYNVTPHEPIPVPAKTITITPHYGHCTSLGFPSTVDMEGCDYVFHIKGTSTPLVSDKYNVDATVDCPPGKHITLTIYSSVHNHTVTNKPFCHITITEKEGTYPSDAYSGLVATDTTNGTGDITGTVSNITAHKKSPTGSILCPEETTNTAALKQDVTISGKNAAGGATSISLSD